MRMLRLTMVSSTIPVILLIPSLLAPCLASYTRVMAAPAPGQLDMWTLSGAGCPCPGSEEGSECPCCAPGGCQCSQGGSRGRCVQCGLHTHCHDSKYELCKMKTRWVNVIILGRELSY